MVFGNLLDRGLSGDDPRPASEGNAALGLIVKGLGEWRRIVPSKDGTLITTDCLYHDRMNVVVCVVGLLHGEQVVVHDGGGAEDRLAAAGRHSNRIDRVLGRVARKYGLKAENAIISSYPSPASDVSALMILVANASQEAALALYNESDKGLRRDLPAEVMRLVGQRYPDASITPNDRVEGASHRAYRFDVSVEGPHGGMLLVNAVLPDANSINAAVVAHIDVGRRTDARYRQAIVYDPATAERFGAANLNLLASVATTISMDNFTSQVDALLAA